MSEFGRRVQENGGLGTDHGHGSVMWLLGGNVRGGRVHGEWRGLQYENLFQGMDVAVTTDYRDVLVWAGERTNPVSPARRWLRQAVIWLTKKRR